MNVQRLSVSESAWSEHDLDRHVGRLGAFGSLLLPPGVEADEAAENADQRYYVLVTAPTPTRATLPRCAEVGAFSSNWLARRCNQRLTDKLSERRRGHELQTSATRPF